MEQNERLYEGPRTRRIGSTRRTIEHAVEQLLHCGQTVVMDWSFLRDNSRVTTEELDEFVLRVNKRYFDIFKHSGHRIEAQVIDRLNHNCTAIHIWVVETNKNLHGTERKS